MRPQLWEGRGRELLGPVAYIDVDGTLAPTLGKKKEGMDMAYKGVWGYHPLIVSLANTGEVLYLVNRPGNAVSHRGAAEWIDRAVGLVAPYVGIPTIPITRSRQNDHRFRRIPITLEESGGP